VEVGAVVVDGTPAEMGIGSAVGEPAAQPVEEDGRDAVVVAAFTEPRGVRTPAPQVSAADVTAAYWWNCGARAGAIDRRIEEQRLPAGREWPGQALC
jgi:hypothetical protein